MKIRPVEGSLVREVGMPQSSRLLRRSSQALLCFFAAPAAADPHSATLMMCLSVAISRPPPALSLAKQKPTSGACRALEALLALLLVFAALLEELTVALRSGETVIGAVSTVFPTAGVAGTALSAVEDVGPVAFTVVAVL